MFTRKYFKDGKVVTEEFPIGTALGAAIYRPDIWVPLFLRLQLPLSDQICLAREIRETRNPSPQNPPENKTTSP